MSSPNLFDLTGRTAVITGGSGVLGRAMAKGLLNAGAQVCLIARDGDRAQRAARELSADPTRAFAYAADATDRASLDAAAQSILARWERVDILINAAGGNSPAATVGPSQNFFELPPQALATTLDANLLGTILPCQVFGKSMAAAGSGSIVNISSMAAMRPLTRIVAYAAAKAGIDNFTRWLAVYLAREFSPALRVNAIAPGFFISEQNRALLLDAATGDLTPRGQSIIAHTPMGRFGEPADLVGTLVWLVAPASTFVTGIVVPVDGGFSAYSGV